MCRIQGTAEVTKTINNRDKSVPVPNKRSKDSNACQIVVDNNNLKTLGINQ